ncbi:MAG: hypothetical protein AAGC47_10390 [Bacteroidota bacterium]
MKLLRFDFKQNWIFHLFVLGYLLLILRMSNALWLGDGINIFTSYSSAVTAEELLVDANKIYWSKTCFLFLTLLLFTLNFDYRFAAGIAASFWSISLILMFELSPILAFVLFLSVILVVQQIHRKQVFSVKRIPESRADSSSLITEK